MKTIRCLVCNNEYDFNLEEEWRSNIKILIDRYGMDKKGNTIIYTVCTACDTFYLMKIKKSFFIMSFELLTKPIKLRKFQKIFNEAYDRTKEEAEEILKKTCGFVSIFDTHSIETLLQNKEKLSVEVEFTEIPLSIFRILESRDIFSIDELGLKYRKTYHEIHYSYNTSEKDKEFSDVSSRFKEMEKRKSIRLELFDPDLVSTFTKY